MKRLIALMLLTIHPLANAQLEWDLDSTGALAYDPFSGAPSTSDLSVNIRRKATSAEDLTLRILPIGGADWTLLGPGNTMTALQLALRGDTPRQPVGPFEVLLSLGENQTSLTATIQFALPPLNYMDAGNWYRDLEVTLVDASDAMIEREEFQVQAQVIANGQVNIAGSSGSRFDDGVNFAVVDFGELETGESERVFVQVRGNSQTRLQISSENQGRMVHRQLADQTIDYNVDIDGVSTSLSSAMELSRRPARDVEGSAYPMTIVIGDTEGRFAGNYHDIISIEVSPE